MKVLFLTFAYPRKTYPFSGIFIHRQAKALKDVGVDVTVCNPLPLVPPFLKSKASKYAAEKREVKDGVEILRPRYLYFPAGLKYREIEANLIAKVAKGCVKKLMKSDGIDIIHAHHLYPTGYAGLLVAKSFSIPLVVSGRGQGVYELPYFSGTLRRKISRVISETDQLVVVCDDMRKEIEKLAHPKNDIKVVYNGVDFTLFNPQACAAERKENLKKELEIPEDAVVVLFVSSSISKLKGVVDALKAFSKLVAEFSEVYMVMIGDESEKEVVENIIETESVGKHIRIVGRVEHKDLPAYYAIGDILIYPSYVEGIPNTLYEGMACGKAVVATKVGGMPELVINMQTGLLIDKGNVEALYRSIKKLILDKNLRKKLADNAGKFISENFGWEKNARQLVSVYQSLLKFKGGN